MGIRNPSSGQYLRGVVGPTGAAGPAGLTAKGAWNSATAYLANDWVTKNGSSYYAVFGNTNQDPTGTITAATVGAINQAPSSQDRLAQPFVLDASMRATGVTITAYGGVITNAVVGIATSLGGGTPVYVSQVTDSLTSGQTKTVTLPAVNLTAGTQYYLVLDGNTTGQKAGNAGATGDSSTSGLTATNLQYGATFGSSLSNTRLSMSLIGTTWSLMAAKGADGAAGATGAGFVNKGTWSSVTTYAPNEVVVRTGSSYVATSASTNVDPAATVAPTARGELTLTTSDIWTYQIIQAFTVNTATTITSLEVKGGSVGQQIGIASDFNSTGTIPWLGKGNIATVTSGYSHADLDAAVSLVPGVTYQLVLNSSSGNWARGSGTQTLSGILATVGGIWYGATFNTNYGTGLAVPFRLMSVLSVWSLLAAAGGTGATGATGATGGLGQQSTVAAGLPAFVGRTPGDLHYESTGNIEYVLTGTAGATRTDTFNRADSTGLGTASGGGTWASRGGSASNIVSNVANAGGQNYIPLAAGDASLSMLINCPASSSAWNLTLYARLDSSSGANLFANVSNSGSSLTLSIGNGGTTQSSVTPSPVIWVASHQYRLTMSTVGSVVTAKLDDVTAGTTCTLTYDTGQNPTGTNAGFSLGGTATADDFQAVNNGTLAWTPVTLRPKGAWNSGTAYLANDWVTKNGSSYYAVTGSTGVDPTVPADTAVGSVGPAANGALGGTSNGVAQGFIPTATMLVHKIKVTFWTTPVAGTYRIGLSAGPSSGTFAPPWVGGTAYVDVVNPASGDVTVTLPAGVTLTGGSQYYVVVQNESGGTVATLGYQFTTGVATGGTTSGGAYGTNWNFQYTTFEVPFTLYQTGLPASWATLAAKGADGASGGGYTRTTAVKTTASLAANAQEAGTVTMTGAAAFRAYRLVTDKPARVRLYTTTAKRDADLTRPVGVEPTGDHGLLLDFVTTATVLSDDLSPAVDGWLPGTAGTVPITIDNLSGSTGTVTATLTYLRTE